MLARLLRGLVAAASNQPKAGFKDAYQLFQQGKLDDAFLACSSLDEAAAGAGNPDFLRGLIAEKKDDHDTAIDYFQLAIAENDREAAFHLALARVAAAGKKLDISAKHYQRALDLMPQSDPARAQVLESLAQIHIWLHDTAAARECFKLSLQIKLKTRLALRRAITLPGAYQSVKEIAETRAEFERDLDVLLDSRLPPLLHPEYEVGTTPFYLAYHGLNDRPLMQKLARVYRSVYATQTEIAHRPGVKNRKIRVGFVSSFFFSHSVGRTTYGLIRDLPRERFEVEVFSITPQLDPSEAAISESCDRYTLLQNNLDEIRQAITAAKLDILFFADIGMHPTTYFMAFWRLAPLQIATWGHPVTTGIDTVDYYISANSLETAQGQDHYSETLVRIDGLYLPRYAKVALDGPQRSRDSLGLPASKHIYLCPQNTFKLHPEFDIAMKLILEQDGNGCIVLPESNPHLTSAIRSRLDRTLGSLASRVYFIPRRPDHASYLHLLAGADVILDPVHFTGCNIPSEAFALGVPVVTLPSEFLRGRFTLGLYNQLGIGDCVAKSIEDYAKIAVGLGCNRESREEASRRIAERSELLFDRPDAALELGRKLEAIATARL